MILLFILIVMLRSRQWLFVSFWSHVKYIVSYHCGIWQRWQKWRRSMR